MATGKNAKNVGPADKGLKVTARPSSFRRAGFTFTSEARVVPLSELTEEQIALIEGDTNLVSQRVDIETPEAS
jgi:hypothetical protein